jgi:excisionase family DNA binding protein
MDAQSEFITIDEVASIYGVKATTIRRWLHSKKIPGEKQPGNHKWMIWRADIERLTARRMA